MKSAVALACSLAVASGSNVEVTPVQKVIQLMEGMLEKGSSTAPCQKNHCIVILCANL